MGPESRDEFREAVDWQARSGEPQSDRSRRSPAWQSQSLVLRDRRRTCVDPGDPVRWSQPASSRM